MRLGVIGVGGRGTGMLGNFLAIPHVQVNAICDSNKEHATHAAEIREALTSAGFTLRAGG